MLSGCGCGEAEEEYDYPGRGALCAGGAVVGGVFLFCEGLAGGWASTSPSFGVGAVMGLTALPFVM